MIELNKENFEQEVMNAEGPVIVDFWGTKCEPCKALMPDVERLAEQYKDKIKFCKLNTAENRRLAISQRVMGLPTFIVYKNGEKIGHVTTGYMSPTLKKNIGVALINTEETKIGNEIDIMIRNKPVKAVTINKRFYKR